MKIQTHIFSCKAYKEIRIQAKSESRARQVLKIKNPYGGPPPPPQTAFALTFEMYFLSAPNGRQRRVKR